MPDWTKRQTLNSLLSQYEQAILDRVTVQKSIDELYVAISSLVEE
jgi:hypothetical protein